MKGTNLTLHSIKSGLNILINNVSNNSESIPKLWRYKLLWIGYSWFSKWNVAFRQWRLYCWYFWRFTMNSKLSISETEISENDGRSTSLILFMIYRHGSDRWFKTWSFHWNFIQLLSGSVSFSGETPLFLFELNDSYCIIIWMNCVTMKAIA